MDLKMIPGLSASALTPTPMQMPSGPPMSSAFQMNPPVTSQFQASPSMTSQFQVNSPVTSQFQVNPPMTSPFQMTPPPPPHSERSEAVGSDRRDESVMGPPPKSGKNEDIVACYELKTVHFYLESFITSEQSNGIDLLWL